MRKIIYLIAVILVAMLFISCIYEKGRRMDSEVIYANAEDTAVCDYDVRLLFEIDDIKVYSFEDNGYTIYFTNCIGKTNYNYRRMVGKCVRTEKIECMCNQNND